MDYSEAASRIGAEFQRIRDASTPGSAEKVAALSRLHRELKDLDCPSARARHWWFVSEAMRHDIAAERAVQPAAMASHRDRAAEFWKSAQELSAGVGTRA